MAIEYKNFTKKGEAKPNNDPVNKRWWLSSDKERSEAITGIVRQIYENDTFRQSQYQKSMRLYGNMNPTGMAGFNSSRVQTKPGPVSDRLTYNVTQSAGDAVAAKIAKNKPKSMFLTSGGSYKLQRKAKKLDKFVEGVFYENGAYQLGPQIFTDAYVLGDGMVQVFAQDGRVKYERVLAGELLTDYSESIYGNPRQMHRLKNIDRQVLIELFPDKEPEILMAKNEGINQSNLTDVVSDQLTVIESWHLRSGKNANDGMHSIVILSGPELMSEPWEKDYFPFAKLTWSKRLLGFWGQGGVEQIQGIQLEINKILWTMQRSFQLHGGTKLWVQIGSKMVKEHITNEIAAIWESEKKPEYIVPPIVPPELYNALKDRKNEAFEVIGVSQLSANSQKPAGLDSGRALREYNNIETERFMILGQAYEHFFLELSRLTVDCARDIFAEDQTLSVKSPNSKFIQSIDFKDADLDDADMILQMFPVSSLPNDPSGRMQTVQEWVQAGWITPRTAKRIQNLPDIEAVEELSNSKEDYLHKIFESMIDDGEYTPPEGFDDLVLAKDLMLQYYAYAKANGVEEDKLDLLRQFNDQVDILKHKAMPPPQPQMSGAPQANPMAAPQSDLIQNTPAA